MLSSFNEPDTVEMMDDDDSSSSSSSSESDDDFKSANSSTKKAEKKGKLKKLNKNHSNDDDDDDDDDEDEDDDDDLDSKTNKICTTITTTATTTSTTTNSTTEIAMHTEYSEFKSVFTDAAFLSWKEKWKDRLAASENSAARLAQMKKSNPFYIPRNYLIEEALENFTRSGDEKLFHLILNAMQTPYTNQKELDFLQIPPQDSDGHYKTYCNT